MTILWEYTVTIMTFLNSSLHFQLINELCGVWVCLLTLIIFTIISIKISLQVSKMRRSLQLSVSSATRTGKFWNKICFSVKIILAWIYSTYHSKLCRGQTADSIYSLIEVKPWWKKPVAYFLCFVRSCRVWLLFKRYFGSFVLWSCFQG